MINFVGNRKWFYIIAAICMVVYFWNSSYFRCSDGYPI